MLATIGAESLDALVDAIVPSSIKLDTPLALPAAINKKEPLAKIRAIAGKNEVYRSFIGQGYYGTHTAERDPAQRSREPGLVHRLHAVSGRDFAGPPRSAD